MNIALYMRMSTDKQDNSIDSQKIILERYALANNYKIVKIYIDEGISGRLAKKRPSFLQMIEDSSKELFSKVLVYDSSRFARNLEESLIYKSILKNNGVLLISATEPTLDDDTSLISDAMMGAINELYSRKLSKSVKRGMAYSASKGKCQGIPPYGYTKINGALIVIQQESYVIQQIFKVFIEKKSYIATSNYINNLGIKTRFNNKWSGRDIKRCLQNPCYIGKISYDSIIYDGIHDPIISEEQFYKVATIISSITSNKKRPQVTYKHILSGLIQCEHCKSTMNFTTIGHTCYFRCSGQSKKICTSSNLISTQKAFTIFLQSIKNLNLKYTNPQLNALPNDNSEIILQTSLSKIEKKLKLLKSAYLSEIDSLQEYSSEKEQLILEKKYILEKLASLNQVTYTKKELDLITIIKSNSFDLSYKILAIQSIIQKILWNKETNSFHVFFNN